LSSEENKRDPELGDDAWQEDGAVEEAEGSPVDPASLEKGESPGAPEDTEVEPATDEEPDPEWDETAVLSVELEATRRDRDQYLDALQRLKAEFENSRKRLRSRFRVWRSWISTRFWRYPRTPLRMRSDAPTVG
jgi:molecular chaperone GrpE